MSRTTPNPHPGVPDRTAEILDHIDDGDTDVALRSLGELSLHARLRIEDMAGHVVLDLSLAQLILDATLRLDLPGGLGSPAPDLTPAASIYTRVLIDSDDELAARVEAARAEAAPTLLEVAS